MGLFGKRKVKVTQLADGLVDSTLGFATPEALTELGKFGLDPKDVRHQREVLYLALTALSISAQSRLDKGVIYPFLNTVAAGVLDRFVRSTDTSEEEFVAGLETRQEEYLGIMNQPAAMFGRSYSVGNYFAALQESVWVDVVWRDARHTAVCRDSGDREAVARRGRCVAAGRG